MDAWGDGVSKLSTPAVGPGESVLSWWHSSELPGMMCLSNAAFSALSLWSVKHMLLSIIWQFKGWKFHDVYQIQYSLKGTESLEEDQFLEERVFCIVNCTPCLRSLKKCSICNQEARPKVKLHGDSYGFSNWLF